MLIDRRGIQKIPKNCFQPNFSSVSESIQVHNSDLRDQRIKKSQKDST